MQSLSILNLLISQTQGTDKQEAPCNCSILAVGHSLGENSDYFPRKLLLRTRLIFPDLGPLYRQRSLFSRLSTGLFPFITRPMLQVCEWLAWEQIRSFSENYINPLFQAAWAFTSKIFPQRIKEYLVLWVSDHQISYFILTVNKCFVYLENIALFWVTDRQSWVSKIPFS